MVRTGHCSLFTDVADNHSKAKSLYLSAIIHCVKLPAVNSTCYYSVTVMLETNSKMSVLEWSFSFISHVYIYYCQI